MAASGGAHWASIMKGVDLENAECRAPPEICGRYGEVFGPSIAASESMRAWGSRYARLVFERCGRNKRATSRFLDISYHTLEAYLRYGYSSRSSGRRMPGWTRPEPDSESVERVR